MSMSPIFFPVTQIIALSLIKISSIMGAPNFTLSLQPPYTASCKKQFHRLKYHTGPHLAEPHHSACP